MFFDCFQVKSSTSFLEKSSCYFKIWYIFKTSTYLSGFEFREILSHISKY